MTADDAMTDHLGPLVTGDALLALAELVAPDRLLEVVDVGASPLVGEPPCYAALLESGLARVTGFEPDPEALAALAEHAGEHARHLGHAVGDGGTHELRRCAAAGFSSLFEPDAAQLAVLTDFPRLAEVLDRTPVPTVRLDDVPELERADLLALDVQGSERAVLDGADRLLATVFTVQVEVGFHRLYEGAPTFADVDLRLRAAGLVPHCFVTSRTWPLAPVGWHDPLQAHSRQLVEADMLYVRDLTTLGAVPEDTLCCAVLLACGAYGSIGLGLVCLRELISRGVLDPGSLDRFREIALAALAPDDAFGGRR